MTDRGYEWQPITDLPSDWADTLRDEAFEQLISTWDEQYDDLRQSDAFREFQARLSRSIAVEAGVIERLYDIDQGVTETLVEQGIREALIPHGAVSRPASEVVDLIEDYREAVEGLFQFVRGGRTLTESYIRELHQTITRHQDTTEGMTDVGRRVQVELLRGEYKKWPNNPRRPDGLVHEYCPPLQVRPQMERLVELHHEHDLLNVPATIEAAWLHHRFTQIHPFQDGNGRVARLLASLVLIRAHLFPLILTRDDRTRYITTLEQADRGDLGPLVALFREIQRRAIQSALDLSTEVMDEASLTPADIARQLAERRQKEVSTANKRAIVLARALHHLTRDRLKETGKETRMRFLELDLPVFTRVDSADSDNEKSAYYYRYQVINTAKQLQYYANLSVESSWVRLILRSGAVRTDVLVSFHGVGRSVRGIMGASACAFWSLEGKIHDIEPLSTLFEITHTEKHDYLTDRYERWLDGVIDAGLRYWNKRLIS